MEYRKLSELKKLEGNPRIIRDKQFKTLCDSIRDNPKYFEARPVILSDRTGSLVIIAGNQRYEAAKALKLKEVPTFLMDGLTEAKEKEIIIRDNISNGEFDFSILANEWDDLPLAEWGVDLPEDWLSPKGEAHEDDFDADAAAEAIKCPVTKPGEVWTLGKHRIMCGDSQKAADVEQLRGGAMADMLLTDPPYGVSYTGKTKNALTIENDTLDDAGLSALVKSSFDIAQKICRPGAYWFATVPPGPLHLIFADDWKRRGILRQIMVWAKDSMVLGHSEYHYQHEPILFGWIPGERHKNQDRTRTTLWQCPRPKSSQEHPTMKPVALWARAITDGSRPGEAVYDPFLGSGTTLIAAEQLGRTCYGMEIDPIYCDVIRQRFETAFPGIEIKRID